MILSDGSVYTAHYLIEHGVGLDRNASREETVRILAKSHAEAVLEALRFAHTAVRRYRPRVVGNGAGTAAVSLKELRIDNIFINIDMVVDGLIGDLQNVRKRINNESREYVTDNRHLPDNL